MNALKVLRVLTDGYSVKILEATHEGPKTAIQLSRKYHIPIAACYRRIKWLEEAGVLTCVDGILGAKERRIGAYTSRFEKASMFCKKRKMRLKIKLTDGGVLNFE